MTICIFPTWEMYPGFLSLKISQPIDVVDPLSAVRARGETIRDYADHAFNRGGKTGRAIRTARYRMVEWLEPGKPTDQAIYDFQKDPLETVNIAATDPKALDRMKSYLAHEPAAKKKVRRKRN